MNEIKTKVPSSEYLDNYDKIFKKADTQKVFIFIEDHQFIMWDSELLDILPREEEHLVEVPSKLVREYNELSLAHSSMQARLQEIYDCKRKSEGSA